MTQEGITIAPIGRVRGADAVGNRALLGVRPENITTEGGPHPGKVRVVENTGPVKVLLVEISGRALHVLVPASDPTRAGDEVRPKVDPAHAVLWPVSGQ